MARTYRLSFVLFPPETPIVDLKTGMATEPMRRVLENFTTNFYGDDGAEDVTLAIPTGSYVAAVAVVANKGISVSGVIAPGYTATLDLAQDIRTTASPQFVGAHFTGNLVIDGTADGRDLSVDGTKLDGIASGATANATDAFLLARANHTGTQAISTVTGLQTSLDGKVTKDATITAASEAHAVTDFATTNAALNALGAIINEMRASFNA